MNFATRSCVFTIFVLVVFCSQHVSRAEGACFFPNELQGEFIMQSIYTAESQVQYSRVNITPEAIPIWGICYRRIGNNFILMDSSSGAANCIRCFQFTLRSRNVLQVKTEEFNRCYTSEEAAESTCPRETDSNYKNLKEVLLYKTKELGGEEIRKEYCPIHGKFSFVYNVNGGGSENSMECGNHASELDTCNMLMPAASLNLHFRSCSFSDHDITFDCLGDWEGPENQRYLALYDTQVTSHNSHPRYRCGMYQKDPRTGDINVAFSSDSTCTTSLVNSTFGYETLALKPLPEPAWPPKVSSSVSRFPSWMQGNWQHMSVANNVITYRDHSRYQTLTIHSMGSDNPFGERLPVYIRDECGGESYNCIWLKNRGANVLEFQLGIYPSAVYNDTLCHNENFNSMWITQGRLERLKESPCPITGQYTGFIPDATGLCAKLSSDCKSHEIMYYTLSDCGQKDVYEEREYRCLGHWKEQDITYTYTQRKDTGIYECFVGLIVSNNEIYIKEAGEHCERNVVPINKGMKLSLEGACTANIPTLVPMPGGGSGVGGPPYTYTQRPPTVTWHTTRHPHATKSWKPITAPPKTIRNEINSSQMNAPAIWVIVGISNFVAFFLYF